MDFLYLFRTGQHLLACCIGFILNLKAVGFFPPRFFFFFKQAVPLVCLSLGADCSTGTDGTRIQNLWSVCTLLQSGLTTGNATSTFVAISDSIEPSCCQSHQGVDWYQKHGSNEAAFCMAMCVCVYWRQWWWKVKFVFLTVGYSLGMFLLLPNPLSLLRSSPSHFYSCV